MARIQLPTALNDHGEEHFPHLRLASFIVAIGAIIAAPAAFSFDLPDLLLVPSGVITACDLYYLVRFATTQPKAAAKVGGFACIIDQLRSNLLYHCIWECWVPLSTRGRPTLVLECHRGLCC
jgi:hypothetical protein